MSDLFDGVKPPRDDRREAPQAAAAPAPAREAAPTTGEKGKPQGVPLSRLWLWFVPLLLAVAAVALWSVSVWLLVAAAVAAVLGAIVTALVWWWQRHRRPGAGRTTRASSWTPVSPGRSGNGGHSSGRTGRGGLFNRGGARRGSDGRTGGASAAPSGHRTGARWSPFNGTSRRAAKAAGRTGGGQAARADRGVRPGRLRSLLGPGRRSGGTPSGPTGGSRAAGRTGGGRRTGAGSTRSAAGVQAGRWARSRANPATWLGPQGASARAARKSARRRKAASKSEKETPTSTKRTEKETGTESGKRRRWLRRRKKTAAKSTTEKPKTAEDTAAKPDTAPKAAEAPKPTAKQPVKAAAPARAPQRKTEPRTAPNPTEVKGDVLVFDEWGFPTRPNPGPRPAPNQHIDNRFHQPKTMTITKAPKATKGSTTMSNTATNPYAHLIDASTRQTLRASASQAAEQARKDAQEREVKAEGLRSDAQAWLEKNAPDIAEPLLTEAAALEQDATLRRAAAAAYDERI